jgi:predicted acylesterase/phospholipase RssA
MPLNPYRQQIRLRDIFSYDISQSFWKNIRQNISGIFRFLRVLFKAIWLFFPSILFIFFAWFAFWQITQGKDLLQRTLENKRIFATFILAEVFWVYITWYASRIIGKIKSASLPDDPDMEDRFWGRFLIQMPRFLAFSCLTIIILAFIKLKCDPNDKAVGWYYLFLVASLFIYNGIYAFWAWCADKADDLPEEKKKIDHVNKYRITTLVLLGMGLAVIQFLAQSFLLLVILLVTFQLGLVLLLVFRRKLIFIKNPSLVKDISITKNFILRVKKFVSDAEDRDYTKMFIIVFFVGLIFYLATIFSVRFSVHIGSVPLLLFSFGMLLILGNGVTFLSVHYRINFHIFFILLALIIGSYRESHYSEIPDKKNTANLFANRQTVNEYFKNWMEQKKSELKDGAEYPVYFVLADGGASRSGYWAASVLAKLNEETNGKFSEHIFCLSGASGGSVGNVAYLNLLRAKQISDTVKHEVIDVQDYLETDFLTFTIARMLGPDVFRYSFVLPFFSDRAAALANVLEKGSGKQSLLYDSLSTCFSEIITQKDKPYSLPVLCINTTRMQDGRPAVISNIDLSDSRYNQRLDFLDLLGEKRDIKMSTAVVLGASFPYLSPAGRVDADNKQHYFVDGGYFDNSGSGVVSEMINILLTDPVYKHYDSTKAIKFYVLHMMNSPEGESALGKVNPLINDLAAPVKTLVGAYGTQTIVNDNRLNNLMKTTYGKDGYYRKFNLYDDGQKITYSMNWVISDKLLEAMNKSLDYNKELKKLAAEINSR